MKIRRIHSESSLYKLDGTDDWYVIVIPGNPGIAGYYEEFMHSLWARLDGRVHIWTVSHRGHGDTFNAGLSFSLADQIDHKAEFLETALPVNARVVLVGHSIGCHMILELLRRRVRAEQVAKCLLLFPTIERMRESPQGRLATPLLSVAALRWLAVALVTLMYLILPAVCRRWLIARWLRHDHPGAVSATERLLAPSVLRNVLYMAHTEMRDVRAPDLDTVRGNRERILLYYGADDHWCPAAYWADMRRTCPDADARLDDRGVAHAFVLEHSDTVAELCAGWVRHCMR